MRALSIALFLILLPLASLQADDSTFPKVGATYSLSYALERADQSRTWPTLVKIIERGEGLWCLVEWETLISPEDQGIPKESTSSKPPLSTKVKERLWINFALLLGAEEKQSGKGTP